MILGIYGAGGLGREVYELACEINRANHRWSKVIFIDDSKDALNLRKVDIIDFTKLIKIRSNEDIEVCIAVGEPEIRELIYKKLISKKVSLATLIHPEVHIPDSTKIGDGAIICKFVSITCDIKIGDNVYVHPFACIGHDAEIRNNSIISSFVDVAGDCFVDEKAFLAMGVLLKQGVKIGSNTIVGLGSVVHNDIPELVIAMGNPARPMKKNLSKRVFK